ncbi:hypothetical protein J1N35_036768 [Gossypium stocksii]|uniref:Transposase MuDR plant domain-containing protein n=1 Tax=Gossypium stocksii TaxID=47602 RepID=A0A9D3UJJ1_9ROSI|nr:hypothetical protein J1N35_036768 [Gossypium stocksii]
MENKFVVCVYFDGEILTTSVGCIFECQKQVAMRFNRNISFDDMKEKISEKIYRRCGRRISKLFYKFPVSMDPINFTKMELVDDEDVETMVALYCHSNQNAPIHLFAELAVVESTEDPTSLGEEDGPQEPCIVVPISYVGSQSTTHGINIDLNAVPETDVGVDIDSDPDVDDVSDDIDDEGVNEDGNINASSVGNQICRIVIHNNPRAHMSQIDPDAAHAAEFLEYPEILPAHQMAIYSDPEELFVGQRFESKEECVFAIKRYSMNISVNYKVVESKPTLYIGECWK